jgi:hypothetical protein
VLLRIETILALQMPFAIDRYRKNRSKLGSKKKKLRSDPKGKKTAQQKAKQKDQLNKKLPVERWNVGQKHHIA